MSEEEAKNTIELRVHEAVEQNVKLARVSDEIKVSETTRRIEAENAALKRELEAITELLHSRPAPAQDTESDAHSIIVSERRMRPQARMSQEINRQRKVHKTFATQPVNVHTLVTFREVCDILNQNYNYEESIKSTTLDIISVYLRGQKVLYIEAKTYCEQQLYALMLPTIAITAICSVISVVLKDFVWSSTLVSSMTATNTFLLALITYLKLDAKAEAHKTSAYSYESLQASCEFSSGKILLEGLANAADDVSTTLEDTKAAAKSHSDTMNMIEVRVKEIKDSNKFVLPEVIRYKYPVVYSTNVFSEVKKLQNEEIILVNKLKVLINKIRKLEEEQASLRPLVYKQQLDDLNVEQDEALDAIIKYRNKYLEIDKTFRAEIEANVAASRKGCGLCRWLKT